MIDKFTFYLKLYGRETFASLSVRNYRLYYLGQVISTSGTFMQSIAQAWLVLKLTQSGTALGIVSALQSIPILVLGPLGGVIADRFSKRTLLYFTQTIAGLLALLLGILVATNVVTLWMVYILAFCLGVINVIDNPARQTFVGEMVGPEHLRNAVSLYSSLINLSRVIGPSLAGVLIAAVGLAPCFIINGISYVAVVIMLYMMNPRELHITPPVTKVKGQLREGFRYIASTPILRTILLMVTLIGTLTFEFQVSLPLLAEFTFHGNAGSYAFLTASFGLGAVFGGLITASRKHSTFRQLVFGALLFGLTTLIASFMPSLLLSGLVLMLVGVCSIYFTSLGNSTLQLQSTPQMRGRVMSFWAIAFLGSTTIGGPVIGWIGGALGPRWGLALGGFAALAAAGVGAVAMLGQGVEVSVPVTSESAAQERLPIPRTSEEAPAEQER